MLSKTARNVLNASALANAPVSFLEVQRVLGLAEEETIEAFSELQRMYLVPAATLVEGIPRFQVNRNLALLLKDLMDGNEEARLNAAIRAVAGTPTGHATHRLVGDYMRQTRVLVDTGRFTDAESTINAGLDGFPNQPRLLGMLGWVYWRWKPPRRADARNTWKRAYELGSRDRIMYLNWSNMEVEEERWQAAGDAARMGLERVSADDARLLQAAGYATSRFGQSLLSSFNYERGRQELESAEKILGTSVRRAQAERLDNFDISRAYRSWILNAQALGHDDDVCDRLAQWLDWNRDDHAAQRELVF